jgi:23S rRNA pseudouridine1911/1915/1917 synthase
VTPHLEILFEDAHCLAVAKLPGQFTLGTWSPPGELALEDAVRRYLSSADPKSVYLGIVHRLDRPTSGVLLWAKTKKAARRLSRQFENRQAIKEYWAVVELHGDAERPGTRSVVAAPSDSSVSAQEQIWTDWLTHVDPTGKVGLAERGSPGARNAVTRVRRAAAAALRPGCQWLRLWPLTGRTHQLRAQAASRGIPVLGDKTYGARMAFSPPDAIALHSRSLRVRHPTLGTELTLIAPLPADWSTQGIVLNDPDAPKESSPLMPR